MSSSFYNKNVKELAQQYFSKSFEKVDESWSQFFPSIIENPNARILDFGACSNRDPKHFAELTGKSHNTENNIQILFAEPSQVQPIIGTQIIQNLKLFEGSLPAPKSSMVVSCLFHLVC